MTKQEFLRFLKIEAEESKTDKTALGCLGKLLEQEFANCPDSIEIETDKGLKDVFSKMQEYASKNKEGNCGCCSQDKAVELALEVFGIKRDKAKKASTVETSAELDLDDLLA